MSPRSASGPHVCWEHGSAQAPLGGNFIARRGTRRRPPVWTPAVISTASLKRPQAPGNLLPPARSSAPLALAAAALLAVPGVGGRGRRRSAGQQRLVRAGPLAGGAGAVFTVRTGSPVALAKLEPQPDTRRAGSRYLCLALSRAGGAANGGSASAARRRTAGSGWRLVNGNGQADRAASAVRGDREAAEPAEAGRRPGPRPTPGWRRTATPGGCWRAAAARCGGAAPSPSPPRRSLAFRLRPVRAVGCTGGSAGLVTNGPRDRKVVALTFDDGPSEYTPGFLDVLARKGRPRHLLRDRPGDAGPRSDDAPDPRRRQRARRPHDEPRRIPRLRADRRRRRADRGLHPLQALPLPPAGRRRRRQRPRHRRQPRDADDHLGRRPARLVDPGHRRDLRHIVGTAQPGSIILMHDGGGPRDETLAALPASSTPCAPAATASRRSPNCSATS